jgi:hypothetical protein
MFCIRFAVPGSGEWWDNNEGKNYVVSFKLAPPIMPPVLSPIKASSETPSPPVAPLTALALVKRSRRLMLSEDRLEDGQSSSPEPEDLRRRLEESRMAEWLEAKKQRKVIDDSPGQSRPQSTNGSTWVVAN